MLMSRYFFKDQDIVGLGALVSSITNRIKQSDVRYKATNSH